VRAAAVVLTLLVVSTVSAAGAGGLVFERADGSTITVPGTPRTWCDGDGLHILTRGSQKQSRWQIGVVRPNVESGRVLRFTWTRPNGVELFVYDSRTRNEASDGAESSRGRIVLRRASCRRGARVEIVVAAVLASELSDGRPIRVSGTFVGPVGARPF
jgi:hypothetical protein